MEKILDKIEWNRNTYLRGLRFSDLNFGQSENCIIEKWHTSKLGLLRCERVVISSYKDSKNLS